MFSACKYLPSYAWRSRVSAKDVINRGARWEIGNGEKVNIWSDFWLPGHCSFKICSPPGELGQEAKVSALIDDETKQWKRDLVFNSFNHFEARLILKIPISVRLPDDKLVWHWKKHGNYSVRSTYHLLNESKAKHSPESSCSSNQSIWKAIWGAPVPNCICNFLWRLARNILPTRSNMEKKGSAIDTPCPLCFSGKECQNHLFMHCPLAQQHYRNQTIFNQGVFIPMEVVATASLFVEDFKEATKSYPAGSRKLTPLQWEPPSPGVSKINVDASCWPDGFLRFGMVVRDHLGSVSFAATMLEHMEWSPTLAEACTLRWCLIWAIKENVAELIIESDAEAVVNCFHGLNKLTEIDVVIQDCVALAARLQCVRICAIRREKNHAAHGLAKLAKEVGHVRFCS